MNYPNSPRFFFDVGPLPKESYYDWSKRLIDSCVNCKDALFYFLKGIQYQHEFFPTPYWVRFPLPILFNRFSDHLVNGIWSRKGRPQDWALNLLAYELSQARMRSKTIGSFLRAECSEMLFGIVKNYEGKLDKDPIYVRINALKKTVGRIISKVYPFST